MTTIDKSLGAGAAIAGVAATSRIVKRNFDFTDASAANADIRHLIYVPAFHFVRDVFLRVTTVEGEAALVDVGDYLVSSGAAVTSNGWLNDASLNSATALRGSTETYPAAGGKIYLADSWISLTMVSAVTYNAAKGTLFATITSLLPGPDAP